MTCIERRFLIVKLRLDSIIIYCFGDIIVSDVPATESYHLRVASNLDWAMQLSEKLDSSDGHT